MTPEKHALIEKITSAFAATSPPDGDITFVEGEGGGRFARDEDAQEWFRKLRNQTWMEVQPELLRALRDYVRAYLTPHAYYYYLPAMLISILKHAEIVDTLIDNLISAISTHWDLNKNVNWRLVEIVSLCTKPQAQVILDFALFMVKESAPYGDTGYEDVAHFWSGVLAAMSADR